MGFVRTPEVGWGDRRAPIRAAHGHIIYITGVAAGVGEGMEGATKEGDENYYGEFYTLKH